MPDDPKLTIVECDPDGFSQVHDLDRWRLCVCCVLCRCRNVIDWGVAFVCVGCNRPLLYREFTESRKG